LKTSSIKVIPSEVPLADSIKPNTSSSDTLINQRVLDILKGSGSYDEKVSSLLTLWQDYPACPELSLGNTDSYIDEVQCHIDLLSMYQS